MSISIPHRKIRGMDGCQVNNITEVQLHRNSSLAAGKYQYLCRPSLSVALNLVTEKKGLRLLSCHVILKGATMKHEPLIQPASRRCSWRYGPKTMLNAFVPTPPSGCVTLRKSDGRMSIRGSSPPHLRQSQVRQKNLVSSRDSRLGSMSSVVTVWLIIIASRIIAGPSFLDPINAQHK